jgi:hypothetical protein
LIFLSDEYFALLLFQRFLLSLGLAWASRFRQVRQPTVIARSLRVFDRGS